VAYLGFHKRENFRWPLVLTKEEGQIKFLIFFPHGDICFAKWGHGPMAPMYTPLPGIRPVPPLARKISAVAIGKNKKTWYGAFRERIFQWSDMKLRLRFFFSWQYIAAD